MRTLIFGASAGVGRALARALAAKGHDLVLLARDERDLEAEAAHVRLAHGATVEWLSVNAVCVAEVLAALKRLPDDPPVTNLLFPLGTANDDDDGLLGAEDAAAIIDVNLMSIIAVVSVLLPGMLQRNAGNIIGFGSVAAIRGRGANVVYAASKRGLESYFESLRHRTGASGVRVQFFRLGYVDTQLSFGRDLVFPKATPEWVAQQVVRRLDSDIGLVHLPKFWWIIGMLVRALPWAVYRRLSF